MADLDTLRPEVRAAMEAMDADVQTLEWLCIRAELLMLAERNAALESKATRDFEWNTELLAANKQAETELAALKARIAGSPRADGQRVFDLLCLPIEFDGTLALVKVEE